MIHNTVASIARWFRAARPERSTKSFNAQMGVHFEEVGEMLAELEGMDGQTRVLIEQAKLAVTNLASHLKGNSDQILVTIPKENEVRYLDALCDQMVTAVGCAHDAGMDINSALNEVSRSNWSKFDANGNPIFDANGKIAKGPLYFKADLSRFV